MNIFCKLFTFDSVGQVLVKLDTDDNQNVEVRIYFAPEGLGVCATAFNFVADEQGDEREKAEKAFALIDEKMAEEIVLKVLETMPKGLLGTNEH